jgi:hypothetical protein
MADGTFADINTAPTAIVFNTGTVGLGTLGLANVSYGTEAARITSNQNLLIGTTSETGTASQRLQVTGGAYVSGSVGIGITNPSYKLEVNGDIKVGELGTLWFSDVPNSIEKIVGTLGELNLYADSEIRFYESDSNIEAFSIDVNNARAFFENDDDTYWYHPAANTHAFVNTGSESLRIDSSGNVGINSTSPTEKLDVIGTVKATDFNTTSDQNLKTNIQTIENPLHKIIQIRGVNFEWKDTQKPSAGVIAQEVEKILPQLVNGGDTKTVNYNGLIGLLIEAVKAQQEEIEELKRKIG